MAGWSVGLVGLVLVSEYVRALAISSSSTFRPFSTYYMLQAQPSATFTFGRWQASRMVHNSVEKEGSIVEEEASQQKSKERRNGIVGPPPVLTPDGKQVKIGGDKGDKNDRRRRNGIVDAPFVGPDGFVTVPHHQADDSRSR